MFPAENKVESLPAAPGHSCSRPFFVFSLGLFFLLPGLAVSSFTLEKSPSPSLPVAQVPEALWTCEGPSYSGCTGIKLLKVYTQAVLIFTYK